jgi:hypothetical protein
LGRARQVLIGGGGDGCDRQPYCVAAATDIQIRTENCYLELGEVETSSDRWRRKWK